MFIRSLLIAVCFWSSAVHADLSSLPTGSAKPALEIPHFPSRLHAFVWRNWECANLEDMAKVIETTPEQVAGVGESMGLPPHQAVSADQFARNYISVIRRNWHLLPYDQLLVLLDWDAEQLAHALKEDDFLWHKLGRLKPICPPLKYAPPDEAAQQRCAEIKSLVTSRFGQLLSEPAEPRFAFVSELSQPMRDHAASIDEHSADAPNQPIRFLYSYFAIFGDPLMQPELNPYPDGLLQRLRQVGVNGVWMHVVLNQLAPSADFPEFGKGWETRLANLRKLVERADRYGIKIYLYMNEPRAMPAEFFENRPQMKGAPEDQFFAMCTSDPTVRKYVTEGLQHVFSQVPGLGGVFTITASENLTNCWSRGSVKHCPRCSQRSGAEVIAEINHAITDGVRAGNPEARTIVWDWAWRNEWCEQIINALPKDIIFMSVSEWDLPITRGGVSTAVGEYSISAPGPGPRAKRNWEFARRAGLKTMAKIQANCTWELSAVPYIPAMNLVAEHCAGRAAAGVENTMLSWTLGGYPSPNLELVNMFSRRPALSVDEALRELAVKRYGPQAAESALAAWALFSHGFSEFPYHGGFVYSGPMQVGPANLLYSKPTGYAATMVGFPYDHVEGWRAVYPAEVLAGQLEKVAQSWMKGLEQFTDVVEKTQTAHQRESAEADRLVAHAAGLHFASAANQVRFVLARNALQAATDPAERDKLTATMQEIARAEIQVASEMLPLVRKDSRIGYEASNHYYYYAVDMIEKAINCEYILRELDRRE